MEEIRGRISLYHGDTVSKDYDINNNKTIGYFWLNKFTDTYDAEASSVSMLFLHGRLINFCVGYLYR